MISQTFTRTLSVCGLLTGMAFASQTNVTLSVPGANLTGTLQTPGTGVKPPVVLILAGSGPTDRDGNSLAGPGGTYRKLAADLAAQGIASLRVDKRGVGQSSVTDKRESSLTFEDYVNDARAWLKWLAQQKQFSQVGLIGHSEGGLIALAAAQNNASIKALVLLSTPGETIGATIRRQVGQNPANPTELVKETNDILTQLEQGKTVAQVSTPLMPLFRPSVQPYLISSLKYDPAKLVAQVTAPTLIVQGDRDLQVRAQDARSLGEAQKTATVIIVPGMNHVLVPSPEDVQANFKTYSDPKISLDQTAVNTVTDFLKTHLSQLRN